jgi:triphosphoribosyl-dephospho-CoA synthase
LTIARDQTAKAYVDACVAELAAPKPGNVHVLAGGHDMEAAHFLAAARASANPLTEPKQPVGMRIFNAVQASMKVALTNTNLGIVLLCAPLAAAAEQEGRGLRDALRRVLHGLDRQDAVFAFRAIVLAGPGGMGTEAVNDIRSEPGCTLREAMAQAEHRDRIARAYVTTFEDIWSLGLPAFAAAEAEHLADWWPAVAVYLEYLAAFPDTHMVRKWGRTEAEWVQKEAGALLAQHRRNRTDQATLQQQLLALDRRIKARGLNPGTSADLTVATIFAARLLTILRNLPDSG